MLFLAPKLNYFHLPREFYIEFHPPLTHDIFSLKKTTEIYSMQYKNRQVNCIIGAYDVKHLEFHIPLAPDWKTYSIHAFLTSCYILPSLFTDSFPHITGSERENVTHQNLFRSFRAYLTISNSYKCLLHVSAYLF